MNAKNVFMPARPLKVCFSLRYHAACNKLALTHLVAFALLVPALIGAQEPRGELRDGIAWRVIGNWSIEGGKRLISEGDFVPPDALLRPVEGTKEHSVTVLLPDGQRILYECFTSRDCARGFRVPALYRSPTASAQELLARVNAVTQTKRKPDDAAGHEDEVPVPRDEAVAQLGTDNAVEVAGLPAALSDGKYSYAVRPVSRVSDRKTLGKQTRRSFVKQGRSVKLLIPSDGLYEITIFDRLNSPRVDLLLAAVRGPRAAKMRKSFGDIEDLLKDWNEDYQGWPVHELRRHYLRSVMLGVKPSEAREPIAAAKHASGSDVACEPVFSPAPGLFKTDTEVSVQCETPGAIVRYTVDGSQPLESAAVYGAPIVVKGTALTIKAYASAPGKKDSPVVTGIFRIGD